ncbi:MAG: MFS transporter [Chloroflexota bacterium]
MAESKSEAQAAEAAPTVPAGEEFRTSEVVTLAGAHFIHDSYGSFIGVLLPLLIEKHALTMAAAGFVATAMRWPGIAMPFLGYLADRYDARAFVIWAPTVTALAISSLGLAPNYLTLVVVLFIAGLSSSAFHPAASAMVTFASGRQWGRATSYFMTGGELARTMGPPFIVAIVTLFGFAYTWLAAIPAVAFSLFAQRRLSGRGQHVRTRPAPANLGLAVRAQSGALALLAGVVTFRSLVISAFQIFYVTYLTSLGVSLVFAGLALAVYEAGGVAGAFLGGSVSDRFGRRQVMAVSQLIAGPVLFAALAWSQEPISLVALFIGGLLTLSAGPVQLALAQELMPGNRSVASGITMFLNFEGTVVASLAIGFLADLVGLQGALAWSVLISMLSLPFTIFLPDTRGPVHGH